MKTLKPIKENNNFYIKDNKLYLTINNEYVRVGGTNKEYTFFINGVLIAQEESYYATMKDGSKVKPVNYHFFDNKGNNVWSDRKYELNFIQHTDYHTYAGHDDHGQRNYNTTEEAYAKPNLRSFTITDKGVVVRKGKLL